MRSQKKQYTANCHEVHQRVGAVVQQHVPLEDHGYKCRASVLLRVCHKTWFPARKSRRVKTRMEVL